MPLTILVWMFESRDVQPEAHGPHAMQPRMAVNVPQHKIINLLKT